MAFGEVGTSLSKIKANSLNLAGTFGFSGTVTGLADETPLVLISTFTSDGSDATASFTSGIDSTYKEYLFVFNNIHPETNSQNLIMKARDGSTNYDATITTTMFSAFHREDDGETGLGYEGGQDEAQTTSGIKLSVGLGTVADECTSGILRLYNPSSTTFVKHFVSTFSVNHAADYAYTWYKAGYCNVTAAIDGVQFSMSSGEIQGGTIDLFGVV